MLHKGTNRQKKRNLRSAEKEEKALAQSAGWHHGMIAQSVEQQTENLRVDGSIPSCPTITIIDP